MDDSMVTARMPKQKKAAVTRVLDRMGTNASAVINELYDYILAHEKLPFDDEASDAARYSMADVLEAMRLLEEISLPEGNEFSQMSDDEITTRRLQRREEVAP